MLRYFAKLSVAGVLAAILGCFVAEQAVAETESPNCGSALSNHLVERQVRAGDAAAMAYLGHKLVQPECSTEQHKQGIRLLARAVKQQNADAMYTLGNMLIASSDGKDGEQLGLTYIARSAELGNIDAAAFYGAHLMAVSRSESDRNDAFRWLGIAANDGSVVAAITVSHLYARGMHGVMQDLCIAAHWRQAAGMLQHPDMDFSTHTETACH